MSTGLQIFNDPITRGLIGDLMNELPNGELSKENLSKLIQLNVVDDVCMPLNRFNKGDLVRCVHKKFDAPCDRWEGDGGSGWELGLEFVVGAQYDNCIVWGGKNGNGVFYNWLELVNSKQ